MAAALTSAVVVGAAFAQDAKRPPLDTNEAYVDAVTQAAPLAIDDPTAVFAFVLNHLPERVTVYPTENYYYFRFMHAGTPYAGNIRFDPRDRDQGKLQFAYSKELVDWIDRVPDDRHVTLDATQRVSVERVEPLVYRVSHNGKIVLFALNDLSQVRPPKAIMGPDEVYIGPSYDELAVRFFFVFNRKLKGFLFLLDETVAVTDDLVSSRSADRILIGRRTGFAFYRDQRIERKILIGAFEVNSRINNYFDGPFDQLPENFIEGEALRQAIIASDPSANGQIDRLGNYLDGQGRFLIHPYMLYRKETDLTKVHRCAAPKIKAADAYYRCFTALGRQEARGPRK